LADSLDPGSYVGLSVTDRGRGMNAAEVSLIFRPFFTTKAPGKGTGLGLCVVKEVADRSGGQVRVLSTPGRGTTMALFLPCSEPAAHRPEPMVSSPRSSCRLQGTVLLIEDEDYLLRLLVRLLEARGLTVHAAAGPDQALSLLEAYLDDIQVLVTDISMPGMGGLELADRIGLRRPGLPVLYLSGRPIEHLGRHRQPPTGSRFLQKPFAPEELLAEIRAMLQEGRGETPSSRRHG